MYSEMVQAFEQIAHGVNTTSAWEIASVLLSGISVLLTLIVIVYNYKSIKLSQKSIKQSINLQLYDKRQELFDQIFEDNAFKRAPESIKILFSESIYQDYCEIVKLCKIRNKYIFPLSALVYEKHNFNKCYYNVCEADMSYLINLVKEELKKIKENHSPNIEYINYIESYTEQIKDKHDKLEKQMEKFLRESLF